VEVRNMSSRLARHRSSGLCMPKRSLVKERTYVSAMTMTMAMLLTSMLMRQGRYSMAM